MRARSRAGAPSNLEGDPGCDCKGEEDGEGGVTSVELPRPLMHASAAGIDVTSSGYAAVVVAETDQVDRVVRKAVLRLGAKLRSGRTVKAEAKGFAERIANDPSSLRVEVLDVVGFCCPTTERPDRLEPIVLSEGKPVPVTQTFLMVAGEYWVATSAEIARRRAEITASCAHSVAEDLFLSEAMMVAIEQADPDTTLGAMSCEAKTSTVELEGDSDGKIARRLPKWITVKAREGSES